MSEVIPWRAPRISYDGSGYESKTPHAEARLVLCRAQNQAKDLKQKLLANARDESTFLRDQAKEEGFSEGYSSGLEKGLRDAELKVAEHVAKLQAMVERFLLEESQIFEELVEEMTTNLSTMVLTVCESMLGEISERSLPMDRIRSAIDSIADGGEVIVRVHPEDKEKWTSHQKLTLVNDESLQRGDFLLEGRAGTVDGTWETRWKRAVEFVKEY